jgi:hypothetical protein
LSGSVSTFSQTHATWTNGLASFGFAIRLSFRLQKTCHGL